MDNVVWKDIPGYEGLYRVSMKKYGINRRTHGEANNKYHINPNELIEEFKKGKTNKELSREYDCPSNLIAVRRYQFRKRGII